MLTKSNAIGYAVLAIVFSKLSEDQVRHLNVESYLNGRESGFAIHFWSGFRGTSRYDRKMVFSNMRSCDGIAVYEGTSYDFNLLGNGLTEEIYKNSRSFSDVESAAQHVVDRLREIKAD